ncbi:MAG TPA: metalloregulator ArsR/SmtB family transcription factor [Stellaceae bacterium]|nr:metalloregulator ArsR/SmtB family transcription factor [Stellaceae bacterium]
MEPTSDLAAVCAPLHRPQLSNQDALGLERLLQALADRYRIKIINMLAQAGTETVCVCEFQGALGLKQPAVSYHLKLLVDAGLIQRRQQSRFVHYSLTPGVLDRVAALVSPARAATTAQRGN